MKRPLVLHVYCYFSTFHGSTFVIMQIITCVFGFNHSVHAFRLDLYENCVYVKKIKSYKFNFVK